MRDEITPEIRAYFSSIGKRGRGIKKDIQPEERARRREWARGLHLRKSKNVAGPVVDKAK